MRDYVAVAALVAQGQTLMHAEAVLLIDDGETKITEDNAFLH